MITGLNHITLAVSNLRRSIQFYHETLDFNLRATWDAGAYLSTGELWLCLSLGQPCPKEDYTHIAFSIDENNLCLFQQSLSDLGVELWQENTSEGESVYFLDPDGHKLEAHVGDLDSRLRSLRTKPYKNLRLL